MPQRIEPVTTVNFIKPKLHLFDAMNNNTKSVLVEFFAAHAVKPVLQDYITTSFSQASRQPNGYRSNNERHISLKTLSVVPTESLRIESSIAHMLEADPKVLAFVSQPREFLITYQQSGTPVTLPIIPDFLVLYRNGRVELIEGKFASELVALVLNKRGRYQENGPGNYVSAPAAAAASFLGISYRIVTDCHLDVGHFIANFILLQPYYLWDLEIPVSRDERKAVLDHIAANPGATFDTLPIADSSRRSDVGYHMLARCELFTHLSAEPLKSQNRVRLFTSLAHIDSTRLDLCVAVKGDHKVRPILVQCATDSLSGAVFWMRTGPACKR